MRTVHAHGGYAAAASDFVHLFDCRRPSVAEVIERLIETQLRAQFCRGYLAMFVEHNLIGLDDANMILEEIAPESWRVRHLPMNFIARSG